MPQYYRGVRDRLPISFSEEGFRRLAQLDLSQYEQEWRTGRPLTETLEEVEFLIQTRGRIPELLHIREALLRKIEEDQTLVSGTSSPRAASIRVASFAEIPEDFQALGGGFFREAHTIWELRAAEDEQGGYVLTRKREELAVDFRPKTAAMSPSLPCSKCAGSLRPGQRLAFVRNGQVVPVMLIELGEEEDEGMALVEDEAGQQAQTPIEYLVTDITVAPSNGDGCPQGCPCRCHPHDAETQDLRGPSQGMDPHVAPSSQADLAGRGHGVAHGAPGVISLVPGSADGHLRGDLGDGDLDSLGGGSVSPLHDAHEPLIPEFEQDGQVGLVIRLGSKRRAADAYDAWGQLVEPTGAFSPVYMGGAFSFDPNSRDIYKVEGMGKAEPEQDKNYGVPNPILPHPDADRGDWWMNDRIRLVPYGGGEPIFVTHQEFAKNFQVMPDGVQRQLMPEMDVETPMEMPGDPVIPDVPWDEADLNEAPTQPEVLETPSLVEEDPSWGDSGWESIIPTNSVAPMNPERTNVIRPTPAPTLQPATQPAAPAQPAQQQRRQPIPRNYQDWGRYQAEAAAETESDADDDEGMACPVCDGSGQGSGGGKCTFCRGKRDLTEKYKHKLGSVGYDERLLESVAGPRRSVVALLGDGHSHRGRYSRSEIRRVLGGLPPETGTSEDPDA